MDHPSASAAAADLGRRFGGVRRLYGDAAYERIAAARVAVVGLGGVGGWAAEALARCGVRQLTLIDLDHVAESNANRQIQALGGEFGKAKVVAMAERIVAINPAAEPRGVEEFIDAGNAGRLLAGIEVVVDCIDQVVAKAALIAEARRLRLGLVTCGAAGGRIDPTRLRIDDLARVRGDRLLASVRQRLRRLHGFAAADGPRSPDLGVRAVHSEEPPPAPVAAGGLACTGYGSSVVVTAPMGFIAAAAALEWIMAP